MVLTPFGPAVGDLVRHRGQDLAQVEHPATPDRNVQVLHRPGAGIQDPRRGRALPHTTQGRGSGQRRREESDPGTRPHPAHAAANVPGCPPGRLTTTCATAPPPCSPHWRSPPAGSVPTPATRGTPTWSSWLSSSRWPPRTPGSSCTSSATTTAPTPTPTSPPGWPNIRGSRCTSP